MVYSCSSKYSATEYKFTVRFVVNENRGEKSRKKIIVWSDPLGSYSKNPPLHKNQRLLVTVMMMMMMMMVVIVMAIGILGWRW